MVGWPHSPIFWLTLLVCCSGCFDDKLDGLSSYSPPPDRTGCVRDEECYLWERCDLANNECIADSSKNLPARSCTNDASCPTGLRCSTLSQRCVTCDAGKYCREYEIPSTRYNPVFYGMYGTLERLWVVGWIFNQSQTDSAALLVRYESGAWILEDIQLDYRLRSIWGTAADDIWAAGSGGTLIHYNGKVWTRQSLDTTSDLYAGWSASRDEVWVVGSKGTVLHRLSPARPFEHEPLTQNGKPYAKTLRAIWGSAPDRLWLGGEGAMFEGHAGAWSEPTALIDDQKTLLALHGIGASELWATWSNSALTSGGVLRSVGAGPWTAVDTRQSVIHSVYAISPGVAYAAGENLIVRLEPDVQLPQKEVLDGTYFGLYPPAAGELWAVGNRTQIDTKEFVVDAIGTVLRQQK